MIARYRQGMFGAWTDVQGLPSANEQMEMVQKVEIR
jgi:hypothetical protein